MTEVVDNSELENINKNELDISEKDVDDKIIFRRQVNFKLAP